MPVRFDTKRWEKIKRDYKDFWDLKSDRPLIYIVIETQEPFRPKPALPYHHHFLRYTADTPEENIIDAIDYHLCGLEYLGDAYPMYYFHSPVLSSAFMGAKAVIGDKSVWMEADEKLPLSEVTLKFDPENIYWKRTLNLYKAAVKFWNGSVLLGMVGMGGNLDTVVPFSGNEELLFAINDEPDEIKRLLYEAHICWWKYFDSINDIIRDTNPGYACWTPYFSEVPTYILQCDFAAMIGPETFKQLVLPELSASAKRQKNVFFHLDGPDMVRHLDHILSIPDLRGIQWVPGPNIKFSDKISIDILKQIKAAGKLINLQIVSVENFEEIDHVSDKLGSLSGVFLNTVNIFKQEDKDMTVNFLERYNCIN